MEKLRTLKHIARRYHADGGSYWFGTMLFLLAVSMKSVPLWGLITVSVLTLGWSAICLLTAVPDSRLKGKKDRAKAEYTGKLKDILLLQYSYRITERLFQQDVNQPWDFVSVTPIEDLLSRKQVRIRIQKTEASSVYAGTVVFDESGELRLSLISETKPLAGENQNYSADRKEQDAELKKWLSQNLDNIKYDISHAQSHGFKSKLESVLMPSEESWDRLKFLLQEEGIQIVKMTSDGFEALTAPQKVPETETA